jgi:ligand-binding sensor domain-containing protein
VKTIFNSNTRSRRTPHGFTCGWARYLLVLAGAFSLLDAAPALDPHKAITQYIHTVWGADNGLPNGNNMVLAQSTDGYLWLGTFNGLFRFDGVTFTFFNRENAPGMKQAAGMGVKALHAGKDGSVWIGTNGVGLLRLKDGGFTTYTIKEGLSNDTVRAIAEGRDGSLWVGTDLGLNHLQDGKFTIYGSGDGLGNNGVKALHEDRNGTLWIGTEGGVDQFRNGTITRYSINGANGEKEQRPVHTIAESRDGSLWIGLFGGGLVRIKDGQQTLFTVKDGLSNDYINSIVEDRDGNLWIGTVGGLNRFTGGRFSAYTVKDGLTHNDVFGLIEDREGNLWMAVDSMEPLNRLRDGKFLTYTYQEGLTGNVAYSIWQRKDGTIMAGADAGLSELKDGRFTAYTKELNGHVTSVIESRDGTLWIGTWGHGVGRLRNGHLTMYTKQDGLTNDTIWCLAEDKEGGVWIGTNDGLNRFQNEKFTSYTVNDGLPSQMVRMLGVDREGNVWIGGNSGLTRFQDGMFRTYTKRDGLSADTPRAIYSDQQGVLWIGTMGGGLNRFKNEKFTAITTRQGLFEDYIMDIHEDDDGHLWLSGQQGISRVSKRDLEDYAAGKIAAVSSTGYDRTDGMRAGLFSGTGPKVCRANDGKLWVPTYSGVVVVDPDHIRTDNLMPAVRIEHALIDGKRIEPDQFGSQPAGRGGLEFQYTAPSFSVPERVKFKYKLEGFDQDWIDAGTRRVAYYTNIPHGRYRFRVMASNSDGVWNQEDASFSFHLAPHFYQTWWFYGLGVTTVGLAAGGGYGVRARKWRTRVSALELRIQELQQEMAERGQAENEIRPMPRLSGKLTETELERS